MSRVLLTGANGFLGRHAAEALRQSGHTVRALLRRESSGPWNEVATGDLTDAASLRHAVRDCDIVVHAAGRVSRDPSDAEMLHQVHVQGTHNLLEAVSQEGGLRFVHVSTSGTIAVSKEPRFVADESHEPAAGTIEKWPYYRSKLYAERLVLAAARGGLDAVVLNPSLLLGPGDFSGSSTGDVRAFLAGEVKIAPPGGLSYCDVRDVAQTIAACAGRERGATGKRYLLTACNEPVAEFLGRLSRIGGVPAPPIRVPARFGKWMAPAVRTLSGVGIDVGSDEQTADMASHTWYADASLAEAELGWSPRDPNETLHDTVSDLQQRGVLWPRR